LGGSRTAPTGLFVCEASPREPALLLRALRADNETTMERGERFGRRSIRLRGYDYTRDGVYFVTMCTRGRERAFGAVVNGEMRPNECGREVARCWAWLAEQYPYVHLDEWIVMPDHTHAIIMITDTREDHAHPDIAYSNVAHLPDANSNQTCRGGSRTAQIRTAPTAGPVEQTTDGVHAIPTQRKPLGRLIGAFKTVSTKRVNEIRSTPNAQLWQRNYHERVIRNSLALDALRRYIVNNPVLWRP
jgi:putative transposase